MASWKDDHVYRYGPHLSLKKKPKRDDVVPRTPPQYIYFSKWKDQEAVKLYREEVRRSMHELQEVNTRACSRAQSLIAINATSLTVLGAIIGLSDMSGKLYILIAFIPLILSLLIGVFGFFRAGDLVVMDVWAGALDTMK